MKFQNVLELITYEIRGAQFPDQPFNNFGTSKSTAQRSGTTQNLPIFWYCGSKIVKGSVGFGSCNDFTRSAPSLGKQEAMPMSSNVLSEQACQ